MYNEFCKGSSYPLKNSYTKVAANILSRYLVTSCCIFPIKHYSYIRRYIGDIDSEEAKL